MNTEIESERINKIAVLEEEKRAIIKANPKWPRDANIRADIRTINQHLAVLEQQGKPSRNPISNHISVYDYAVMYVSLF